MHKENDHAGAFLLLHGRYSVLAHYLKVSLKNSRFLKIPKLHPQKGQPFFGYSCRMAASALIFTARLAGARPETNPMTVAKASAASSSHGGMMEMTSLPAP